MAAMEFLLIDTGRRGRLPLNEVIDRPTLEHLGPLIRPGEHVERATRCKVTVDLDGGAALVTVARDGDPLVTFGVAKDVAGADALWPRLERLTVAGAKVTRPLTIPWIAVRFEIGLALHPQDETWLGDFERCWAWAWLLSDEMMV